MVTMVCTTGHSRAIKCNVDNFQSPCGLETIDIYYKNAPPVPITFTCDSKRKVSGERNSDRSGWRLRRYPVGENLGQNAEVDSDRISHDTDGAIVSKDRQWIVGIAGTEVMVNDTTTKEVIGVG